MLEHGKAVPLSRAELTAAAAPARPTDDAEAAKPAVAVLLDRFAVTDDNRHRGRDSLESAYRWGKGDLFVRLGDEMLMFSSHLRCCGKTYSDPTPALFSFNHPAGRETCRGFGRTMDIDPDMVIPNPALSVGEGAIKPFMSPANQACQADLLRFMKRRRFPVTKPWRDLPEDVRDVIWSGEPGGASDPYNKWYGVSGFFDWLEGKSYKMHVRVLLSRYRRYNTCPSCKGGRLRPEALRFRLDGKTVPDVDNLSLADAHAFFAAVTPNDNDKPARLLLQEILGRLSFLVSVGLPYLTLGRQSRTLSGGEAQRVGLATALGGALANTLYVLDEPSVGLHARDGETLIGSLRALAARNNAVVVVEHDPAFIRGADHVIDLGPGPGHDGGNVVYQGPRRGWQKQRNRSPDAMYTGLGLKLLWARGRGQTHFRLRRRGLVRTLFRAL